MKTFIALIAMALPAFGQWENLNPGGGGQIQAIVADPHTKSRLYWCSDMEGIYRSDDLGERWDYLGVGLPMSNTMTLLVDENDPQRLYAGQHLGISVSADGGKTWRIAPEVPDPIAVIVQDPNDPDVLVAGPGSRFRWSGDWSEEGAPVGKRGIWISRDRGATWKFADYTEGEGRRDVFAIAFDDSGPWLATMSGLYRPISDGDKWKRVAGPIGSAGCWGVAFSPDGGRIFTTFTIPEAGDAEPSGAGGPGNVVTPLFAASTSTLEWTDLSAGAPEQLREAVAQSGLWRPVVDPRSTPDRQQILVAPWTKRLGLLEVSVATDSKGLLIGEWRQPLFYDHPVRVGWDAGWEHYSTRPLSWLYSPAEWGDDRWIVTTGDQTVFRAKAGVGKEPSEWDQIYTNFVRDIDGVRFYRTRGAQSTFVFDGEADGTYSAQCNGDNAVLESYDTGSSWTIGISQPRSNSISILRQLVPMVVLAHTSSGFGADSNNGTLWAKRLEHRSASDEWIEVGGGPKRRGGLPDNLYNQIVPDPHRPGRVYIGTRYAHVWMIEDIEKFIAGEQPAVNISEPFGGPATVNDKGVGMAVDPNEPNVVWAVGTADGRSAMGGQLWRGERRGDGWDWKVVRDNGSDPSQLAVLDLSGQTAVAFERREGEGDEWLEVTLDGGVSWKRIFDLDEARGLRSNQLGTNWYDQTNPRLDLAGLTGDGNELYVAYVSPWDQARGYGIFRGRVADDGETTWDDVTGDLPFPYPVKMRVIDDGARYLYLASKGMGWWRRRLP